jgi:hypothetical protein
VILDRNLQDAEKARKLVEELERLRAERSAFEGVWKEAQALVSSVELSFNVAEGGSAEGYKIPRRITNRPANFQETLVSGLCGYGVNPNITWMKLGLADQGLMRRYGVKDWLQAVEQAEYEEMDNSSFYTEMKMVVDQAVTFGFGIMSIDEDVPNGTTRFRQIDVPEVYLDVNEHNEYETVFRRFYMSVENAVSRFGLGRMGEEVKNLWNNGESGAARKRELEILHAVFRRKNRKGESGRNTEMPFASFYVDVSARHVIEESGYRSFPYAVFAWDRVGGKKYPVSPAIKAINDVKLLHKTEDTRLTLAQMAAKQPVAIPETMRKANDVFGKDGYIRPGAVIYYDAGAGEGVPQGISMGGNYPITLEITRDMADRIKDWFYVDFFLMLQRQGNVNQMTATAVQALQGEKASVMTNMIVNLKKALQAAVQRTYDVMSRQGRLPELPEALLRPPGGEGNRMKFTFASVLSQIQQAALRYQGAQRFLPVAGAVANLGQAYPPALEALDRFDFDAILQNEARAANMPETAIREDEDVEAIKERRAQAQAAAAQQAQEQQAQEEIARNYNKLNEPPKPGSPAAALFGEGAA